MFDNRKIKQIRHLPEGNNIVLIWVMLLTIAGRCNAGGMIFLTENIPYTIESLAIELDFDQTVVQLALDVLRKFGMIVCDENEFSICGWEEHQNVEGMDKVKEQSRKRVAAYRERQKANAATLPPVTSNVTRNVTVTQSNAADKEKERDKEIELEKDILPQLPQKQDDCFEEWWDLYPKKSGDIRQAYQEYLFALDDVPAIDLLNALKAQTENLPESELRYFPSADKWLRNRTWKKRVAPKEKAQRSFTPTEF